MLRLVRYGVLLAMLVVALLLCLDVAYFFRGSLEEFPTDEQTDKIRTVTAALAAVLVAVETLLWWVHRELARSEIPRQRAGDGGVSPPSA